MTTIFNGNKTRASVLRDVLVLSLMLALTACKGSDDTQQSKKPEIDPYLVELSADLQKKVTLMKVGQADIREVLRIPGSIQVDEQRMAKIGAPVTGRITDIDAVLGQHVTQGQALATLNSTELAQNQLVYIKALQQIDLQSKAVERARILLEADVISKAEVQRRESELSAAKADLNAAADQLQVLGMTSQGIAKLSKNSQMHSFSTVTARISGTVISRKINLGQVVQPADELFIVADLSKVYAVAEVPERQIDLIEKGQEVDILIPSINEKPIKGKLVYVSDIVNPETRTVMVRSELSNVNREIKPDMLVSMLVQSKPIAKLSVPVRSIVRQNDKNYVFVQISANKYRLREVDVGDEFNAMRPIIGGVEEGETIVTDGAFHLNNERKRKELE
ncbi:efflux RND transporter periplasmic adaptor subunit [Candidatus Methylopumilus turicensis]|uniref:Efflux transporter, RND family, MFP subunit n=1 Tax=Candidatus Methylopumilus turicensis TaxID=1581680 RepID=A0A0B7IWG6_9PROT|nr:efflux RND transporter periplasmic adaptor subunit [Candidatus Methylopumilus turicensis]CEN55427.1 Efflux transporter, RND family, MFP subunit [Candidatus Methylopumilus turicensis]